MSDRTYSIEEYQREQRVSNAEQLLAGQLRQAGLGEPAREYRFHDSRRWRVDFAWPEHKLAVEVEGLTHEGGRHQRKAGFAADLEKYNTLELMGWTLLRFEQDAIKSGEAVRLIEQALKGFTS